MDDKEIVLKLIDYFIPEASDDEVFMQYLIERLDSYFDYSFLEQMPSIRTNPLTGEKGCRPYKRADLCLFAKQAYEAGKETFTVRPVNPSQPLGDLELCENEIAAYSCDLTIDKDVYEQWIQGIFTKTICEARTRNHMMKAATMAEELGLKEGTDFFLVKDNCLTELEPEEVDENGIGRTLTCIGFRPLSDDLAHTISRKYQLYR